MSFTLFSLTTSLLTPICLSRVTRKCVWTRHRLDSCCENSDFLFRAICVIIKNSFSQNNSSAPKAKISIQFYLIQSPIRSAVQSDPSHPIRVLLTANIKLVIMSNIISHTHFQQINAMIWHFLVFFSAFGATTEYRAIFKGLHFSLKLFHINLILNKWRLILGVKTCESHEWR